MRNLILALGMLVCVTACNRQTPGQVLVTASVDDCKMTGATAKMLTDKYPTAFLKLGDAAGYGPASKTVQDWKKVLADYKALGGDMSRVVYSSALHVTFCGSVAGACWYGVPHQEKFKHEWIKQVSPENVAWSVPNMNGGKNPWVDHTCCGIADWINKEETFKSGFPGLYNFGSVVMDVGNKEYQEWLAQVLVSIYQELGFTADDAFLTEFGAKPGNMNYWDGVGPGGNCSKPEGHIWGGCGMQKQGAVYKDGEFGPGYNRIMGVIGLRVREKFPKARFSTVERPAFKTTWSLVSDANTNLLIGEQYNQLGTCTQ